MPMTSKFNQIASDSSTPGMSAAADGATKTRTPIEIRTLFLSDLHLGSRHCQAESLLGLLQHYQPEAIYLVGDALDGRELKHQWHWPEVYNRILARFAELRDLGTEIFYTPGNHDEFMRHLLAHVPAQFVCSAVKVAHEFVHITASGKRLLVLHGDQFDQHEHRRWKSRLTSFTYDKLLKFDRCLRYLGYVSPRHHDSFCNWMKQRIARLQRFFAQYRQTLVDHAVSRQMDGIICGHIHQPLLDESGPALYVNTGDWLEHCSAIIESDSGELKLVFYHDLAAQAVMDEVSGRSTSLPLSADVALPV